MERAVDAIWKEAERSFDEWLAAQSDEVQELGVLEQIDLYAAATSVGAA